MFVDNGTQARSVALQRRLVLVLILSCAGAWSGSISSAAGTITSDAAPVVHGHVLKHRWVYLQNNFQADGNVERMIGLLDRAKAAGYNGAIVVDTKFGRLDDGSLIPRYYTNLQTVLRHARTLDMELIPGTMSFGYSSPILWHNPDLAEGLPVEDATFRAEEGRLVPYEASPVRIANGDFEALPSSGHQFPGWAWQDQPGTTTFVDRQVKHGGRASLRMTDIGLTNPPYGHGRIHQRLAVEPFKSYHVSVWVKTQDFRGGDVRVLALGRNPSRTLQWNEVPVQPTQDWRRFDVTFNTLTHSEVLFYFGVWGGGTGTIWWDDGNIEPAGFVNMIRRPGAPVRLTNMDGATVYEEGRDVERIFDPRTGTVPYNGVFNLWHQPPSVRLTPGSRIRDGDVVKVSYYHVASVYGFQVACSLTEPAVFEITDVQLASVRREFAAADVFNGWMFNHDEIRVHGWDEAPRAGGGTPGEDLAFNFRTLYDQAAAIEPNGTVHAWSDMFDPFHNAADREDPYYLVNGNWHGSWEGVPPDVVIMNWNHNPEKRRDSAAFFAGRGHRQILAGYYDTPPDRFYDRDWLRDLEGLPGIEGVLYTQWGSGYDNLEAWAEHVWGDAPLVTLTPPGSPSPPPTTPPPPGNTPTATVTPVTASPTPGSLSSTHIYLPFNARSENRASASSDSQLGDAIMVESRFGRGQVPRSDCPWARSHREHDP